MKNQIPSSPMMKQGIVAVLGPESNSTKPAAAAAAASIRRTLSADMSSKNWLHQDGFPSPVKKSPPPSEDFHPTPGDRDDVWRSIQSNQETPKMESWDSILSRKKETPLLPHPYVSPLVKRSLSGLSDESLEICTERLGSESGSDSFPPSNCSTECLSEEYQVKEQGKLVGRAHKFKNSPAQPLPPLLSSIAGGGASQLRVESHRENGRLILNAVPVSPGNYFEAQRGDGRLVLTLVRGGEKVAEEESEKSEESEGVEEVFDQFDEMEDVPAEEEVVDDGGGDEEGEELMVDNEIESKSLSFSGGMMSVCKKGLVMKKFVAMGKMNMNMKMNKNTAWSNKEEFPVIQSLPAGSPMAARLLSDTTATSFNAYEYFWRSKTTSEAVKDKDLGKNQNLVMGKGKKGEGLDPFSRGCYEPRRSLLFWEPHCIAT